MSVMLRGGLMSYSGVSGASELQLVSSLRASSFSLKEMGVPYADSVHTEQTKWGVWLPQGKEEGQEAQE